MEKNELARRIGVIMRRSLQQELSHVNKGVIPLSFDEDLSPRKKPLSKQALVKQLTVLDARLKKLNPDKVLVWYQTELESKPKTYTGLTIAVIWIGDMRYCGMSKTHRKDRFTKKMGRLVALGRAVKALETPGKGGVAWHVINDGKTSKMVPFWMAHQMLPVNKEEVSNGK